VKKYVTRENSNKIWRRKTGLKMKAARSTSEGEVFQKGDI
jgi:hypothetical protein